ncbi:phosphoglycerate kinase precursor [Nostoc cycadae WK-1]|uniref:Phosphoglycerate kinase n=1 Tax=Nostoc cycadae WK-1 TaxID=1861711 RepID=A0A2H6LGG2_9NOSO|nr:phosphoglycerate kinase precursor [Nostoc cycadae WK-1]
MLGDEIAELIEEMVEEMIIMLDVDRIMKDPTKNAQLIGLQKLAVGFLVLSC